MRVVAAAKVPSRVSELRDRTFRWNQYFTELFGLMKLAHGAA